MIKSRTAQLVFQTAYCVLGIIGFAGSLGLFDARFNDEFFVYYTNLSNYICLCVMLIALAKTIKRARGGEDGYCEVSPAFNFMCVIMIMVTFLVYNILLAKDYTVVEYFTSLSNLIMHLILPIMFILNWALFYEHQKIKWYYPLLALAMPLIYVFFIVIRAQLLKGSADKTLYPYFFLNIDNLGWGGFLMWIGILLVAFTALGYLLYALDNVEAIKSKFKRG